MPNEHVTFIVGPARSGTTWLGKIFDSHPDVLYRHEPDLRLACETLVGQPRRTILGRFIGDRSLRTAGKLPLFAKTDLSRVGQALQFGVVFGLRVLGRLGLPMKSLGVPEFMERRRKSRLRVVLKSVLPHGCIRLVRQSLPGSRVILILRHPCGQVASLMQGAAAGKFESNSPIDSDIAAAFARRCGEATPLNDLPLVAQYAWNWAAFTETLFRELHGYDDVRVVRYEDLCSNPQGEARRLLAFAGLSWHEQTARFIARSTQSKRDASYYSVYRTTTERPNRWRTVLSAADQAIVLDIADRAGFAHFWANDPIEANAPQEATWEHAVPGQSGILQSA